MKNGCAFSLPASYSAGRRRTTSEAAKNCAMIIENVALLCIAGSVHKLFAIHPRASVILVSPPGACIQQFKQLYERDYATNGRIVCACSKVHVACVVAMAGNCCCNIYKHNDV